MFGGKRGMFASQRTPYQLCSTGVAASCCGVVCCRRDWCTSQNRWHLEEEKLCGYIEVTSQDISQEVKWVFQMDNDPKHTSKVVEKNGLRTRKSRYWSGHHKALTSIL
jgi:hypothetical protein